MSSVTDGKIILASNEASVQGKKLILVNAYTKGNKLTFGKVGENVNVNAGKYSYRQFYLYNEKEEFLNLNESPMMLLAPEGLGVNLSPSSNDLSNGFFRVTDKDKIPQGNIVCDILFDEVNADPNTAYGTYRNFVDFVMGAEKLYVGYIPAKSMVTDLDEYRCEVALDYINKSQINWSRCLRCPVSFRVLTPWFKTTTIKNRVIVSADTATVTLDRATGHIPAGIKVSFTHRGMSEFILELKGNTTQKSYGKCSVSGTIDRNDVIEYSSVSNDCYVRKISGDTVTDLIDKVDITFNPWFGVPTTEETTLIVTATRAGDVQYVTAQLDIEVFEYYRSV